MFFFLFFFDLSSGSSKQIYVMRRLSLLHAFVHPGIGMLFYRQKVRIFAFLHRKVMDRGERIDSLLDKTSALKAESVGSSGMSGGDVGILSVFR